jgi:hypothetical protein
MKKGGDVKPHRGKIVSEAESFTGEFFLGWPKKAACLGYPALTPALTPRHTLPSVPSPKSLELRRRSVGCFSRRERSAAIWIITVERATRKNSQLAAARRVALKMGRLLRCSSVTYRSRYAPLAPVRLGPPRRRPILNATKLKGFRRRYTSTMCPVMRRNRRR